MARSRFASIALVVIIIITFTWGLEVLETDRVELAERSNVLSELSIVRAKLEEALNTRLFLMRGMMAYVATNTDIDIPEFQELASTIVKNETGIRSIQLAKDTVVSHVYPLAGNEQAVGLRLLDLPLQRLAVKRALDSRTTVVAGPVDLVQGGVAFISRTPIYISLSKVSDADSLYWGLATVLISRDIIFEEAGLFNRSSEIQISIRGKDGLGAQGEVFYGKEEIWQSQPVTLGVNLPNGLWQLAAVPINGWNAGSSRIWWIRIGGMTIASITGILLWFLFTYQVRVQESEKHFRAMVENLPAGTVYVKSSKILMNQGMENITGYKRSELTTVDQWFDVLCGSKKEEVKRQYRKDAREGFPSVRELTIFDRDGIQRELNFTGYKDHLQEIWLVEDVTDRKLIEKQRNFLEMQHLKSQRMETIGTLAGGVAHDFNNILTPILGYAEMCQIQYPEKSPGSNYIQHIITAAERARDLVKQILTFSRMETLEKRPLNIGPIVKESVGLMRATLPATINIEENIDDRAGVVMANPTHIEQITVNLITNAYQAMPAGGTLYVGVKKSILDSEFLLINKNLKKANTVELSIRDTGQGMDKETQSRIFEPFFTTKETGSGSGLGLSVIHGIVTDYGGAIEIESKLDIGTTLKIYFPESKTEVLPPVEAVSKVTGGHESILVVDDEEEIAVMLEKILEQNGYSVSCWFHAEEALEAFCNDPDHYDLVITDQTMPRMSGVEFSKELFKIRHDIPIILMSGFSDSVNKETALMLGIRDFMMKPVAFKELNASIRKILDE